MSGARYTHWTHVVVAGDRDAAAPYVPYARKLLGFVMDEAQRNGLGTHKVERTLDDGTRVIAEKHGDIPRVTIVPVSESAEDLPKGRAGFVVYARNAGMPAGIHEDYPQQILRVVDGAWRTYFYSGEAAGYDAFPGAKGVYLDTFPEGIVHAGQIDWRDHGGARISWYGPSTRYWFDAWRQPSAQYGRFVFYLGQVLLDVDQYCADNEEDWPERLVLGAAMRVIDGQRWLYVMLADIPDQDTPIVSVPPNTVYFTQNYPLGDVAHCLVRMRLVKDPLVVGSGWRVVAESAETVWSGAIERACSPWVFNPSCTKATTFRQLQAPVFGFSDEMSTTVIGTPPAESSRCELTFDGSPVLAITPTVLDVGTSEADVAVDYDENGAEVQIKLAREPHENSPHAIHLVMGNARVPLYWKSSDYASPHTGHSVRRLLVGCDARVGAALFDRRDWYEGNTVQRVVSVEVFYGGALQAETTVNTATGSASGYARYDRDAGAMESTSAYPVGPLTWFFALSAQGAFAENRGAFIGLTAATTVIPFHPDDTFGQSRATNAVTTANSTPVASFTADRFYNNRTDVHGNRSTVGFAADAGLVVMSMYDIRKSYTDLGGLAVNDSIGYATGSALHALTGVGGAQARWHPCWVLGEPIGEAA